MKAILINPFEETITEVEYTGDYKQIYDLIDCRTFDVAMAKENNDLYLDDEGLLKDNQRYFRMLEIGANYAGKGLILAHNDEGESVGTTLTLQEVKNMVEFLPEGHVEKPYMEFVAWQ